MVSVFVAGVFAFDAGFIAGPETSLGIVAGDTTLTAVGNVSSFGTLSGIDSLGCVCAGARTGSGVALGTEVSVCTKVCIEDLTGVRNQTSWAASCCCVSG